MEQQREVDIDEETDETIPTLKKRRRSSILDDENSLDAKVTKMMNELKEVKSEIQKFHDLSFRHKFSASFLSELEDSFTCIICKRIPAKKPLIGCVECSSVIGCQACVNQWYSGTNGLHKKCPKCRCERGLSKTIVFRGFDNLLVQIKNLRDTSSDESEESDGSQLDDTLPIVI